MLASINWMESEADRSVIQIPGQVDGLGWLSERPPSFQDADEPQVHKQQETSYVSLTKIAHLCLQLILLEASLINHKLSKHLEDAVWQPCLWPLSVLLYTGVLYSDRV